MLINSRLLFKLVAFAIILSTNITILFAQTPNIGWTKSSEQNIYNQYYSLVDGKIKDEFTKQQLLSCCVDKTKTYFPNGVSALPDSISQKVLNQCVKEIKDKFIFKQWTPEIEAFQKKIFFNFDRSLDTIYRAQLADCMVSKLKIIYPSGLTGEISNDVAVDLSKTCATEIMKLLKWTPQFEAELKEGFKLTPAIKKLPPAIKEALCNCYIRETKRLYPIGLPDGQISKQSSKIVINRCKLAKIVKELQ